MKTGSFITLSLLGLAAAQPHGHRHARFHKKRDMVTDWVTTTVSAPAAVVIVDSAGNVLYTSYQGGAGPAPTPPAPSVNQAVVAEAAPSGGGALVVQYSSPGDLLTPPAPTGITLPPPIIGSPPPSTPAETEAPAAPPAASPASPPAVASDLPDVPPVAPSTPQTPAPSSPGSSDNLTNEGGGFGISYAPYNDDGSCKSQDQVNADFASLSGYSVVRSYGVDCDQVNTISTAAKAHNMKVFLGIFNLASPQMSTDISTLISAINGDWSHVHTVSIGNEDVNQGKATPSEVVDATNAGRAQLRAAGYQGPVVHVDTFNQLIDHPEICGASDYAAANCHAFFDANTAAADAGAYVLKQAQAVSDACGGKETWITESGWPHAGDANGAAVPSDANQQAAIGSLKDSFSSNIFLFSAFDDPWKQDNAGTFGAEHYWGFIH